jgi:hypothetical protein
VSSPRFTKMADSVVKRYDPDDASVEYSANKKSATWTVKAGLAQMLKGAWRGRRTGAGCEWPPFGGRHERPARAKAAPLVRTR